MFLASEEGYSKAVMLQTRFHGLFQKLICALNVSMIVKTPSTFREYNLPLIEEMLNLLLLQSRCWLKFFSAPQSTITSSRVVIANSRDPAPP
jgi:hypothetical protein